MKVLRPILDLIAPEDCLSCGREGSALCAWCSADAFDTLPDRCFKCLASSPDSSVCKKCRHGTPIRRVFVRTLYKDLAKDLVQHMKFNPSRSVAEVLARQMTQSLPYLSEGTLVCAVPTSRVRVRQRGFDHCQILAREIAGMKGLRHQPVLIRYGRSKQVGSKRENRISQVKGVYVANHKYSIKDRNILLIDDVVTTGATISEAATELKKAGAKSVDACIFAQSI